MSRRITVTLTFLSFTLAAAPVWAVSSGSVTFTHSSLPRKKTSGKVPVAGRVTPPAGSKTSTADKSLTGERLAANPTDDTSPGGKSVVGPTATTVSKGLITKEELFSRLRAALPGGPADPNAPAVIGALIDEIKQRGVQYFKLVPAEIYRLVRRDPKLDLVATIEHNYDPPCKPDWLLGTWNLLAVGGPVEYKPGEGYVYRQKGSPAKSGTLTLNPDGTYRWKPGPDESVITGNWREATPTEMWLQGGAGLVLLRGETGQDWIARRAINRSFKGEYLDLAALDPRFRDGKRRIGKRQ